MMNFDEVINKRQSIRNYDNKEVTYEELETLINATRFAPSAKNRQPWRFYILTDEEKDDIVSMMYEWDKLNRDEKTSVKGTANQMKEANKVIMVYYPLYKSKQKTLIIKSQIIFHLERVPGIEPGLSGRKHDILPLNYTRKITICILKMQVRNLIPNLTFWCRWPESNRHGR